MDYFDEEEQREKEKLEEKKYQEIYQRQSQMSRVVLLVVFSIMGFIFILLGSILLATSQQTELVVFIGLEAFCIVLGILFYFLIPKKGNYQRYKSIVQKRGGLNLFDLSISVNLLEGRISSLEKENQYLKRKLEELERNTK